MRSALVRTEQLAQFAQEIDLGQVIFLGRGEEASGGRERPALLCGAFEALVGAIYLEGGMEAVSAFMEPRLVQAMATVFEDESLLDPRSQLQVWAQAEVGLTPRYRTVDSYGPDHAREFVVEVTVGDEASGRGVGKSKQEAAQRAAADALTRIGTRA
jgi:ribonuclease-3